MAGSYWDKYALRRISRRRMLQSAGVAGAAAGAVWVVGCGSSDNNNTSTPTGGNGETPGATSEPQGTPVRGGRYQIGTEVDFDTFDPHLSIAGGVAYFPRLYNALMVQSPVKTDFVFNDMAESLEQPDDTTYVFKLRPGVKIAQNQLGVPERDMDANDVVASFQRIKDLPQSNAYAFVGQWVDSVTPSDDGQTVTIKTPKPYGYFMLRIGSAINLIAPKELIDDPDKMKQAAAGAGPFVLNPGNYTEGQGAKLDANTNYYRKDESNNNAQLPYINGMDIRIILDRSAQRTAFQSGQIDLYSAQNKAESDQLMGSGNYHLVRQPVFTFVSFTMNPTRKPWDDDRVRKAMLHAIDRQVYIDRIYQGEAKANGLVHWPLGDFALPQSELDDLQKYDPAESKKLLESAGLTLPVDVKIMYPANTIIEEHNDHLPIFLQQMRDAGFNVQEDAQPFGTWLDNYTNIQYDASLALNQVYEYAEFNMDWQHSEGPARNNIYGIGVGKLYPEIDAAIDESKSVTDPEEFPKKVQEVQRQIYDVGPGFLPIVSPYSFTLYQPYVKNIPEGLGSTGLFLNNWWLEKA